MKKTILTLLAIFVMAGASAGNYVPSEENLKSREDFAADRFGIFLHWGLYAMFAQGEWYLQNADINKDEYAKSMNAFYPHSFDAKAWVKAIKAAGARYITFTTRHHEGFSMWNTQFSDYNIMNTPYGRDIVKQLADACHEEGIALHLYYSHIDWTRDDYPMGRTGRGTGKDPKKADWKQYYTFMNNQLTELLTNYGAIRCIWFDGFWDRDEDPVPFDWEYEKQYKLIHDLQPSCLVGNNHHQVPNPGEDIQIFERDVPGENKAGLSGQSYKNNLPLETCQTMNGMWGYKVIDQNYKSTKELIQLLVRTSGKGANLLLNIGPQADGNLPATALSRLKDMGEWLKENGETIYGTTAGPALCGEQWVTTQKGKKIWVHVLDKSTAAVALTGVKSVKNVCEFHGKSVKFALNDGVLTFKTDCEGDRPDWIFEVTLK